MRLIQKANLQNKNVLLRIDADVPLKNGQILNDERLKTSVPTIQHLLDKGVNKITIIGHLGRPNGKIVEELRLKPVEDRLVQLLGSHHDWEMRENLRFNPGEEKNDLRFAQELARNQDIFVQDAFATCHRRHASTFAICHLLSSYAGFALQKEIENLKKIIENPHRPFVVVIGGAKIEDKKPVIDGFLGKADKILVGGTVGNVLQKEKENLSSKIILPTDGRPDLVGRDIGPKTIERFKEIILDAKTIFWAGPMGEYEELAYANGTEKISQAIIQSSARKFAGGGDTSAFIFKNHFQDKFDFVSLAGGAALEFLAGKVLPGLAALE